MVLRLNKTDIDFDVAFARLLTMKREQDVNVNLAVADIINEVRERGDAALCNYTKRFDRNDITRDMLRVSPEEIDRAEADCPHETLQALDVAAKRIADFHARQKPQDERFTDAQGVELGHRWTAVSAAGIYVPGGLANYPSSVLMNALPAKVAGVDRLVMVVPMPEGKVNPLVLAAAKRAGVNEIYKVGGAQAIAALAYGTETIEPVDVIVGPGNAYVAAAKKQVFGYVGIDMVAGPSEILVVADAENDPAWIAADLLSQAEHDSVAQSILMTDDVAFAEAVCNEVERQLSDLPREEIARQSWENFGAIVLVPDLTQYGPALIDRLAPEHLELAVKDPESLSDNIRNAGAIFLGRYTPEAIGDYIAGPNHVLPTARASRYASGLSVLNFMKRTSLVSCSADSLKEIGMDAIRLAESEGLSAHARSVAIRLNKN
ncbi:MAG: histidinol dehydrogenase [Rhodobiaceae bacterium]|nr:histidinol dehydrogenase [Rhodobiaceae bacterium]